MLINSYITDSTLSELVECGEIKSFKNYGGYVEIELYPQLKDCNVTINLTSYSKESQENEKPSAELENKNND